MEGLEDRSMLSVTPHIAVNASTTQSMGQLHDDSNALITSIESLDQRLAFINGQLGVAGHGSGGVNLTSGQIQTEFTNVASVADGIVSGLEDFDRQLAFLSGINGQSSDFGQEITGAVTQAESLLAMIESIDRGVYFATGQLSAQASNATFSTPFINQVGGLSTNTATLLDGFDELSRQLTVIDGQMSAANSNDAGGTKLSIDTQFVSAAEHVDQLQFGVQSLDRGLWYLNGELSLSAQGSVTTNLAFHFENEIDSLSSQADMLLQTADTANRDLAQLNGQVSVSAEPSLSLQNEVSGLSERVATLVGGFESVDRRLAFVSGETSATGSAIRRLLKTE